MHGDADRSACYSHLDSSTKCWSVRLRVSTMKSIKLPAHHICCPWTSLPLERGMVLSYAHWHALVLTNLNAGESWPRRLVLILAVVIQHLHRSVQPHHYPTVPLRHSAAFLLFHLMFLRKLPMLFKAPATSLPQHVSTHPTKSLKVAITSTDF